MVGLSVISEMYEYSLTSFLQVFNNSLKEARKDSILENRLRSIIEKLTLNVYDYTCLGIFEVHKLMFSFQMTLNIKEDELNKQHLDFFLKGNTSLDEVQTEKPYSWITQNGWKDLQRLVTIGDEFKGLIEDLDVHGNEWKQWYDSEKPELEEGNLPGKFSKLSSFEVLLLLRVFRPDRIINGIKRYIVEQHRNN